MISTKTKMTLHKIPVRVAATYACKTWILIKTGETAIGPSERWILRSIFGAVQDKGQWKRRENFI
jgi:hypothetical protein